MVKKSLRILLALSALLSVVGLTPSFSAVPITIQGKVTDSNTKSPIAEAGIILLGPSGKTIASTLTNSSGEYQINTSTASRYYLLKASKRGYIPQVLRKLLQTGKAYTISFTLKSIPNRPPKIVKIRPKANSTFLAGANIKIQVRAVDANRDPLEYQFLIGGTVKQAWSTANTYNWQTTEADTGATDITCEVRDNKGGQDTKTIPCQIINPTVEEILQKVADNYAKIYDFKADMVFSSTLNGQPFGKTEYCRYYFMAPNKEKTETYSDQERNKKTDIIIIDGSTMHLIDPVKNIKQDVDLLTETGMDAAQFDQMNIYYNQPIFLSQNIVTKNNTDSEFNNMVIALDVNPNNQNNVYDKLAISINYLKGIISEYSIYKKNESGELELVQETKAINAHEMPNSAWIPVKMIKTPNLSSGALISTLTYSNVQINAGLTDLDFNPNKQ
jgi:outer membrane lipoprotein-sorting protein